MGPIWHRIFVALPAALVVAARTGWRMARTRLAPVGTRAEQAEHISAQSASQPKEAREMQHTHKPMGRWVPVMALAPLLLACTGTPGVARASSRSVAGKPCIQLVQVQQRGQAAVQVPSTVETLETRPREAQPGGPLAPPVGAAGPPPLGAAGLPPVDAVGPPPLGAAGPPPVDAVGPPPLGAAGSLRAPLAEPSQGRPSPVQPRRGR